MRKKVEVPLLSEELIDYLEVHFPEQCADLNDRDRDIWYKSGQRSVVKHLKEKFHLQKET